MRKAKADEPKWGCHTTSHKNGLITKRYFMNGYLHGTYKRCPDPEKMQFKSPMVNDHNQWLCGGYGRGDMYTEWWSEDLAIMQRVVDGLKPFGSVITRELETGFEDDPHFQSYAEKHKVKAAECNQKVLTMAWEVAKLDHVGVNIQRPPWDKDGDRLSIEIYRKGSLEDLFDLQKLVYDYNEHLPNCGADEMIEDHFDNTLEWYMDNQWDIEHNLPMITGLILGYPIENTISRLYFGSQKR